MTDEHLLARLSPKERELLEALSGDEEAEAMSARTGKDLVEIVRTAQFLQNKGLVTVETTEIDEWELSDLGRQLKEEGLPDKQLYDAIPAEGLAMRDVAERTGLERKEIGGALGRLKDAGAVTLEKGVLQRTGTPAEFRTAQLLEKYPDLTAEERDALLEKRLLVERRTNTQKLRLTAEGKKAREAVAKSTTEYVERLTPAMLKDGSWKDAEFRRYDVTFPLPHKHAGRKHFVQEAIDAIKRLWLEMGFSEMEGSMTQTAFKDLDVLFVPQDHPAREMQDTFYLPESGELPDWWEKVKRVHEDGGDTGSAGWEYAYSKEEAERVLLRTHTTALSAEMLTRLDPEDLPAKFFSVSKVFRNETLDWKHLAEFHQVEGIVVGEGLSLRDLIGLQQEFYRKMGFEKIRFRPAYFPYTEPSAEVEVFHPVKKQWVELGGMGIFRPEVVKTLLGKDIPVLAWGLGMERIITDYYDITDLRELYGNDLGQLRDMKAYIPAEVRDADD